MMIAKIDSLIDKQDTNEIIRDQIAAILAIENANQVDRAKASGKNIEDFDFDVYIERSRPWEVLTSSDGDPIGMMPLVNVVYDGDSFNGKNSNQTERQRATGIFYIDCYAHKNKTKLMAGDRATSLEADRIARLVRNIIMSAHYETLGLGWQNFGQGLNLVYSRMITKREKFVPQIDNKSFENVIGSRITLEVEYDEYAPQYTPTDLDLLVFKCNITENGLIYFEANFDMTT
jgi:hypothetical protein